MSYPKLNTDSDTTLEQPDLDKIREDRLERNREVMKVNLSDLQEILKKYLILSLNC